MKIGSAVLPGRVPEKKKDRTRQDSQKTSHKVAIFRLYGEKLRVTILQGGQISHFPIDF